MKIFNENDLTLAITDIAEQINQIIKKMDSNRMNIPSVHEGLENIQDSLVDLLVEMVKR